ncbi:MAG TPA: ribosome maturation factor RimM [Polyangiaceae bacterium]
MGEVRWVALAEIARPHGVWGEVRVKVYNTDSDLLASRREVLVRRRDGREETMQLESIRGADTGHMLIKFGGIDDRDAAEPLRGSTLCVRRDEFPPLPEGEFYVCDVIGARLVGPSGELGTIVDLATYPSTEVLVVQLDDPPKQRAEIPLVEDFVERVDTSLDQVVLRNEGLEFLRGVVTERSDAD